MAGYGASQRRELGLLGCVVEGVALERLHETLCERKRPDERPWPIARGRTRGRAGPDENVYRQDAVRLWIARFVCARMRERTRRLHVGRDTPVRKVRRRCVRSSEHRFRGLSREMQGDWCDAKNWDTKLDGRSFVYVVRGSWSWAGSEWTGQTAAIFRGIARGAQTRRRRLLSHSHVAHPAPHEAQILPLSSDLPYSILSLNPPALADAHPPETCTAGPKSILSLLAHSPISISTASTI